MKRIYFSSKPDVTLIEKSVLTIGCFDGVHKGHQQLIHEVKKESKKKNLPSCFCIFHPHPLSVLKEESSFQRLFTINEIEKSLESYELDYFCIIPFNYSFSRISAEEFIHKIHSQLNPACMVVGYDFAFGADRKGAIKDLQNKGKELHFEVKQVPAFILDNQPVSSSRIREFLSEGNMDKVTELLGYPFFMMSSVVRGDGQGRKLGFPTANLEINEKYLPKKGVYSARVQNQEEWYKAAVNIGNKPTFSTNKISVEVHIIGENLDLYGSTLFLEWGEWIREEKTFSSILELKKQIQKDIKKILN